MDAPIQQVTTPVGDPAWLVTNYDDIKVLLADPRLGRSHAQPEQAARVSHSGIFGGPVSQAIFGAPITHPLTEDAGHAMFRQLVSPAFSARRIASLRPQIAGIITDLLDAMTHQVQPVDLHDAVCFPLPARVICELLGVPFTDRTISAAGATTLHTGPMPNALRRR